MSEPWIVWKYRRTDPPYEWFLKAEPAALRPGQCITATGYGPAAETYMLALGPDEEGLPVPPEKPFTVPTMSEIDALAGSAGLVAASTFSGAGGSCLGYKMAGFDVRWANEFEPTAAQCYRDNFGSTLLNTSDIRSLEVQRVLDELGMSEGELDLFDGSPPCQSFSTSGKRHKGWGKTVAHGDGTTQRSDDLFFEYARLLAGLRPRVFVAENVAGLVKGVAKGYFKLILAALRACGYTVEAALVDAQWLGVPQSRQRVIFVGVRDDLAAAGYRPAFPAPAPERYSMADALPWIREARLYKNAHASVPDEESTITTQRSSHMIAYSRGRDSYKGGLIDAEEGTSPTITASDAGLMIASPRPEDFPHVDPAELVCPPPSKSLQRKAEALLRGAPLNTPGDAVHGPGKSFNLSIADPDKPVRAVCAMYGNGSVAQVMPSPWRRFCILEVKRLCSFPDDYRMNGSYAQQWARLGNAVPPLMMRAVAETVRDKILLPARAAGL